MISVRIFAGLLALSSMLTGPLAFAAPTPSEMLAEMRAAHGGDALMTLTSARMRLYTREPGAKLPHVTDMHYDFRNTAIAKEETSEAGLERKIAGAGRGYSYIDGHCAPLPEAEENKMMRSLYSNFLFLLSDSQTILAPAEPGAPTTAPYAGLAWYNIYRPGWKGFHIGVDTETGLIGGLWFGGKSYGRELDYRRIDGVMWPYRFEIYEGSKLVNTGHFSDLMFSRTGDDEIKVPDYCMQLLTPK
ncbi:hypothetical protein [Kordiimonas sp.]|uniref:hypothetical protein n=1 Tax=Kordiimonas sp. TaxID=1970157 RepID=UPI003A8E53D7